MTDSAERPRMLSAASRSILSSNRRIVICKSSAYSFWAATISTNQDARVVAVTVPDVVGSASVLHTNFGMMIRMPVRAQPTLRCQP
jgi:hypothetical protein